MWGLAITWRRLLRGLSVALGRCLAEGTARPPTLKAGVLRSDDVPAVRAIDRSYNSGNEAIECGRRYCREVIDF